MRIPDEYALLEPTLTLFPEGRFRRFEQVPLGRKKIDIVCLKRRAPFVCAVELKVSKWREALWQAVVNAQIADESYIAVWHEFAHRAERNADLIRAYRIGLISVETRSASFVFKPTSPQRIAKRAKGAWYRHLLGCT